MVKIQFDELKYQQDAVNSVIKLFEGHQIKPTNFTISDNNMQGKFFNEYGVGNRIVSNQEELLENLQQVQIENNIPISESLPDSYPQFNIEMETGTGKTFVYLKSILELNKSYGFTKFIIVVPSVAIKEGVVKSLEMTKDYFKTQMNGIIYHSFMYDSGRLNQVQDFAQSEDIEIMVINIQAFSKGKKNNDNMNIIYRDNMDALYGIRPIDLISQANPIVIIDEPQSVDNTDNAKEAINALNPSVTFRYSATHKNKQYPLIYRLGPVEAYEQELVKQVEVAGVRNDVDGNEAYLSLKDVKANKQTITAHVEMYVKKKGEIVKDIVKLKKGDELYLKSKKISTYEAVGFVQDISAEPGNEHIEFSGEPSLIKLSESYENDKLIKRTQIRKTIEEHMDKELKLNKQNVKVLSLFFIDNVSKYRVYDDEGKKLKGQYAEMFEEEYQDLIQKEKYRELRDKDVPVEDVHDGYFSIDGKGKVKNTKGDTKADESTYKSIMQDKENLLTIYDESKGNVKKANKLRFIFSHSALKEGWDNPNVFEICTLIETKDTITKRQKIGRGLRIAVNQEGDRVPGFDVNTLTVMANESYEEFARELQSEYEKEGMKFGVFEDNVFSSLVLKTDPLGKKVPLGNQKSKELVTYFKENGYVDSKNKGTDVLAEVVKEDALEIPGSFNELGENVNKKVMDIINNKFDYNKVEIKNREARVSVKLKKEALAEPFIELWDKIKYKTNYVINFDSDSFIEKVAEKMNRELYVHKAKVEYYKAFLVKEDAGINTYGESNTAIEESLNEYNTVPDIISYLQNETKLTRKTLIAILKQSDTLNEFKRNPQMYMMEVARIISASMKMQIVDGIKYEKNLDYYDQKLFVQDEITTYEDKALEIKDNRTPYTHIIYDSKVERDFALECEQDDNVKYYIKLPSWFNIKTPLGLYNPDWAVLLDKYGDERVYFVVETKGSNDSDDLRATEFAKIQCGSKHFDAIDPGIVFRQTSSQKALY